MITTEGNNSRKKEKSINNGIVRGQFFLININPEEIDTRSIRPPKIKKKV